MTMTSLRQPRSRRTARSERPTLSFTPYAWGKLLFLRDRRRTEIGGFGVTPVDRPLFVEDIQLVRQRCCPVSVQFEDGAVADFFDEQVDRGLQPSQFGRIWLHTHPGSSATPSVTDEETFARVFGDCAWSVMAIVARGGETYARLQIQAGPRVSVEIPVEVDFGGPFEGSGIAAWEAEYDACVAAVLREQIPSFEILDPEPFSSFDLFADRTFEAACW